MTRELTGHHVNECNEAILIEVLDEPGNGGACHKYRLTLPSGATTDLSFQDGPDQGGWHQRDHARGATHCPY